jgi:hypothetical protein
VRPTPRVSASAEADAPRIRRYVHVGGDASDSDRRRDERYGPGCRTISVPVAVPAAVTRLLCQPKPGEIRQDPGPGRERRPSLRSSPGYRDR